MAQDDAHQRYARRGPPTAWTEPNDQLLDWLHDDLKVDAGCPQVRQGARDEMSGAALADNPYYWPGMTPRDRAAFTPIAKLWVNGWIVSAHFFGRLDRDAYEAHRAAFERWANDNPPWSDMRTFPPRLPPGVMKGPWPGPGRR